MADTGADSEDASIDPELLKRLQSRVKEDSGRGPKRVLAPELTRHPSRAMPHIRALHSLTSKSEAARHSGVHLFVEATAAGKGLSDILPVVNSQPQFKLEPSFDEHASPEDMKVIEQMFQQRVEEYRRSRLLVQQLNERPEEGNDDENDLHTRPNSPGQEYDLQYMQHAIKAPRFRARVHENVLAMQGMTSQDRQKFLSSAKDVEDSLLREHAKQKDEPGTATTSSDANSKRRRIPRAPRAPKTIQKEL